MSIFVEEIINRLPADSELRKLDNPMRKVLMNTLGVWLDNFEEYDWFDEFFIDSAEGNWLDLHGTDFNVIRKIDETDEEYRTRIIFESLGHLTTKFLMQIYNVELYSQVADFDIKTSMVSDNEYISNSYFAVADTDTQKILNKKFILGTVIEWL